MAGRWKGRGMEMKDEEEQDPDGLELSLKALIEYIADTHPLDQTTLKHFSIFDRITVPSYYTKLLDVLNYKKLSIFYQQSKRKAMKFCCGYEKKSFVKPKSL